MSTLQLIWGSQATYELWAWDNRNVHRTAQIVRCIKGRVYLVRIGARAMEPTDVIAAKIARGKEEVEDMDREFKFYEKELKNLQGTVVPRCYGFFTTKVNGEHLGCLLLEYCSGPPANRNSTAQFNLHAAYELHSAGVLHGDLEEGHHFIPMGLETRIVDFTTAVLHQCVSGLSQRAEDHDLHRPCRCQELALLENRAYRRH